MERFPSRRVRVSAELLSLASGGAARVERAGDGAPLVVLLTPISGINPYIEAMQASLVGHGFTVAAVDYWAREGAVPQITNTDEAMAAVAKVRDPDVTSDVDAVCSALDAPATAALGFCIGGTQAILAGAKVDAIGSAISFYGLLRYRETSDAKPEIPLDVAKSGLQIPYLGHWGDNDQLIPVDHVDELRAGLAGRPAEIYVYPGAGHGFHEAHRPDAYRPVAATEAWERTLAFLRWNLLAS